MPGLALTAIFMVWLESAPMRLRNTRKNFVAKLYLHFAPPKKRQELLATVILPGVDVRTSTPTNSGALDYLGKVAAAIVKEAKSECDKAHCQFLLAYLPIQSRYRDPKEAQIIGNFSKQMNIDFVDLNPEFDQTERVSSAPLYIDIHPSKAGPSTDGGLLAKAPREERHPERESTSWSHLALPVQRT